MNWILKLCIVCIGVSTSPLPPPPKKKPPPSKNWSPVKPPFILKIWLEAQPSLPLQKGGAHYGLCMDNAIVLIASSIQPDQVWACWKNQQKSNDLADQFFQFIDYLEHNLNYQATATTLQVFQWSYIFYNVL